MQKWEYLFIHFSYDAQKEGWYPNYISEPTLREELNSAHQDEAANYLGGLGWEMISYAPIVGSTPMRSAVTLSGISMVYKRPKE